MKQGWTLERIKEGFERFFNENKRYPTSHEVDDYDHLPSARQIQRRYGGLPKLRSELKLRGPRDFTKGKYGSERTHKVKLRSHTIERNIYKYLISKFRQEFVHREYFFTDDRRTRTDFYICHDNGNFLIDVFYPKDLRSLTSCLNSKMMTYEGNVMLQHPVIFLVANEDISDEEVNRVVLNKKNKLLKNQNVMTLRQFKTYCESKII